MHKFLRAVGFSDIRKRDLEQILNDIIEKPDRMKATKDSQGNEFAEFTCEFAPHMGIVVCGTYEDDDIFEMEYYYPYLEASSVTTQEQIEVQRYADREAYAGVCDELRIGVTLIFYMQNVADYLVEKKMHEHVILHGACLSALSTDGKILLPVSQKKKQIEKGDYKYNQRSQLIAKAREGDEDAIESLTLEDMDTYSILSKRIVQEDILSIVSNCFMPYGIESDQYSIIGDILEYSLIENYITKEQIYRMKIECNDVVFDLCMNKADLVGEPEVGRRFKGNIWMQGSLCL